MPSSNATLLIVDDDPLILDTLSYLLRGEFDVVTASTRQQAIEFARDRRGLLDLALLDLGLPPQPHRPDEGLALISELLAHDPFCKIIVLSGQNDEANARHARTLGALEFIAKPAQPEVLRRTLHNALALRGREQAQHDRSPGADRLVGHSRAVEDLRQRLAQCAAARFPVLIEGESGSGKEAAALALHELTPSAHRPFVALNCAAIAPGLIEATLFGHGRGAFTGAVGAQAGYVEEAGDGTLFLDEIGELPLELQPKLLRLLENGDYQRVGETQKRQLRARVVAATNRDLRQEVRAGRFRADLFHRLSVLRLRMPALREMGDDRLILLDYYLRQYSAELGMQPFSLDAQALDRWSNYDFPGNVRELRNIIVRLLSRYAGQTVSADALDVELEEDEPSPKNDSHSKDTAPPSWGDALATLKREGGVDLDAALRKLERDYIAAALNLARGNMSQAARLLGINRSTLYNRMETLARYGEPVAEDESSDGANKHVS